MKKRIIIVDDDNNILMGLKRALRKQRRDWDMFFLDSGEKVLAFLSEEPCDAIISDMRMPEMDGAKLLDEVSRRHPEMIRFILSGHSDQEMVMKTVGSSHQYLSKPCDPDLLKSKLDDAFRLRDILSSTHIRKVVAGMTHIPSIPSVYKDVVRELDSPDSSLVDIGRVIEKDPLMSSKILQLANSAYFGVGRNLTRPLDAVSYLGFDTLKSVLLTEGVFSQFDSTIIPALSIDEVRHRSTIVSQLARSIASMVDDDTALANQAFLSGLIHEMGVLILAANLPGEYTTVLSEVSSGVSLFQAEQTVLGTTNAQVGACILGLWGIDREVVAAVAFQNEPWLSSMEKFSALSALSIALNIFRMSGNCAGDKFDSKMLDYINRLGCAEMIDDWLSIAGSKMEEAV